MQGILKPAGGKGGGGGEEEDEDEEDDEEEGGDKEVDVMRLRLYEQSKLR